jgi:hypothetical protein
LSRKPPLCRLAHLRRFHRRPPLLRSHAGVEAGQGQSACEILETMKFRPWKLSILLVLGALAALLPSAAMPRSAHPASSSGTWSYASADQTLVTIKLALDNGACQLLVAPMAQGISIQAVNGPVTLNPQTPLPHPFIGLQANPPVGAGGTLQFSIQTSPALPATTVINVQVYPACNAGTGLEQLDVAQAPQTAPPPPPTACKCSKIDLTTTPVNFTDDRNFELALNWTIHCTGGAGTCRGEIDSLPPLVETPPGPVATDLVIAKNRRVLHCAGRCGRLSRGTFYVIGRSPKQWARTARAGHIFLFEFHLWCADTPGSKRSTLANGSSR